MKKSNDINYETLILNELKNNNRITQLEIAKKLGITDRTVRRNIKKLKDKHIITLLGTSTKDRYWKVNDEKMKERFLEEITTNFSELLVGTFLIRYMADYDIKDILESIKIVKELTNNKINNNFEKELLKMGFKKD